MDPWIPAAATPQAALDGYESDDDTEYPLHDDSIQPAVAGPIEKFCKLRAYLIPDKPTPLGWVIRMLRETKGLQAQEDITQ
jgi:hypothetical protein